MSGRILVTASPGEVRAVALGTDGRLADFAIWRPGAPDGIGDVYRGRLIKRAPTLSGAFVSLGQEPDGFLPDTEGAAGLAEGESVMVRITRSAQGGKGPRLSARIDDTFTAGPPGLLRRGPDPVLRLARLWPAAPIEVDDPTIRAHLAAALPERARAGGGFDATLEEEVAGLAESTIGLAGGAILHIHPTPALIAIDLDAGRLASGREPARHAHQALNLAVIPEISRQIRLRNLSGAILVDLAGLVPRQRRRLADTFAASLASDPLGPRFLGFTALGLAEIVRPRIGPPLHELLASAHAAGLAALRAVAAEDRAAPGSAWALRAAPAIVAALEQDAASLDAVARLTGRPLMLRSDPTLAPPRWTLEGVP
ncbi:MAG TPA: ribonuclease E/G [Acetobacteraceae bacterium]|nr:ribonuclease E/G [Acetobacteraceae bacterium]